MKSNEINELENALARLHSNDYKESFFWRHYLSIVFCILFIFIIAGAVWMHEATHQAIFNSYGVDAKIGFKFPFYAYTDPVGHCPKDTDCEMLHSMNEIISYNLQAVEMILFVAFLFIIISLEIKRYDI